MVMMKIYLAAPFFSPEQIDRLERVEEALAKNPTVTQVYSPRQHQESQAEQFTPAWAAEIFKRDVGQVLDADALVVVADFHDNDADSGTAFEQGLAWATKKPIVLFEETDYPTNLMLTESLTAFMKTSDALMNYDFSQCPALPYDGKIM
ncbi:purine deoxyribosyltransferase [Weissella halotolerans DSM 20190]|uniref:Purine deoxyribosyltransferase n=2 Tax=Weissella halotolerans TaxID=1615 RepID=A0A0R2G834_9LACO|nr:purine deoxyribosyltransferase [Weissella halotolerans DSM 20190]